MGKNGKTHIFPWAKMGLDPPSILPSLISGKGHCKDFFFENSNNKDLYPISNFKTYEILKNNKNCIGTFSKDNVPILKTMNQQ